jgi:flagellar motor switch protein FliN/FliY
VSEQFDPSNAAAAPAGGAMAATVLDRAGRTELGLLASVDTELSVVIGRSRVPIRELLSLDPGSVIELDRRPGDPCEVLVNGTLVARGEVVIVEGEFGVRIVELVRPGTDAQA